jgi:hypothetical protein
VHHGSRNVPSLHPNIIKSSTHYLKSGAYELGLSEQSGTRLGVELVTVSGLANYSVDFPAFFAFVDRALAKADNLTLAAALIFLFWAGPPDVF